MLVRVMLVGDEPARVPLEEVVSADSIWVDRVASGAFWQDLGRRAFDLALVSAAELPPDIGAAVQQLRQFPHKPELAVLAPEPTGEQALRWLEVGLYAVLPADGDSELLARTLARLASRRGEKLSLSVRAAQLPRPQPIDELVSKSPVTRQLLGIARRVAVSDTSLLLLGETGSGKEWLARAIHAEGPRAAGPFIAINCGAIPENLLESELFGHEKGAFTGALRTRRGYFEQAHGGTLFLDEIGEMPSQLQVRLLRVLQDRTIQRLGGDRGIEVDTRIIAATHRDLKRAIDSGEFRSDLYYRLAVVTLTVPALCERQEDIPALAELYLENYRQKLGRHEVEGISEAAMQALTAYRWPGNVRELINVMERAVLLCDGTMIDLVDLPIEISGSVASSGSGGPEGDLGATDDRALILADALLDQPLDAARLTLVAEFERRYLHRLLELHAGNVGKTSEHAGIDPRTLYNKMRQLGLRKEDFKS